MGYSSRDTICYSTKQVSIDFLKNKYYTNYYLWLQWDEVRHQEQKIDENVEIKQHTLKQPMSQRRNHQRN